ncbi:MAG TPA: class I SAM-dependent methyltransferase [bacterium]|nr:class I SAM-dependent methyltransferase [bacterium]
MRRRKKSLHTMSIYRRFAEAYAKAGRGRFSLELVPWVTAVFERFGAAPTSLVDVACGAGEFALAMARSGIAVTGVDQSPEMLALARQSAAASGVPITLLEQDMRELVVPASVDAATCLYDSLNYLVDEAEFRRTLAAVAVALRPNGLFLFDMITLRGLAERWGNRTWIIQDTDDAFEADQSHFDYDTGIATLRVNAFLHRREGLYERIEEVHRERGYPVPVIDAALAATGFERLGCWSSPTFDAVTPDTARVFYAVRRGRA